MQKPRTMTLKDIERLAKANALKESQARQTGRMRNSVFWNKPVQNEHPRRERGFDFAAAVRSNNRMLHDAVSSLNCDSAGRALLMGANVDSIVDCWTLRMRIDHVKETVPPKAEGLFANNCARDAEMGKIDAMVRLLNEWGAGL